MSRFGFWIGRGGSSSVKRGADAQADRSDSGTSRERRQILVESIREHVRRHALEWKDFRLLLRQHLEISGLDAKKVRRIESAAEAVVREGAVPEDVTGLRMLVDELEDVLDVRLTVRPEGDSTVTGKLLRLVDINVLDSKLARVRKTGVAAFAVLLFLFISYVVFGGLVSGESDLLRNYDPLATVLLFLLLIAVLAVFEALHISVTILRLIDLKALRGDYPRAFRLHRIFRREEGTRRFLAGRQLMVIVTVFFAARMTSFPDLDQWPFTEATFPRAMQPWFGKIFLEYGVAGALFVLWSGQLAPQFLANRHARRLMNFRATSGAFRWALFLAALGLTRPGEWLSGRADEEEQPPWSAEERYRQAVEQIEGLGIIGSKRVWEIGATSCTLYGETSTVFANPGFQGLTDESVELPASSPHPRVEHVLIPGDAGSTLGEREIIGSDLEYEWLDEEHSVRRFRQWLKPSLGSFQPGDIVVSKVRVTPLDPTLSRDGLTILRPTKYILFRVRVTGRADRIGPAHVRIFRLETDEETTPVRSLELQPQRDDDNVRCFEYIEFYPDVRSYYELKWDVEYVPWRQQEREVMRAEEVPYDPTTGDGGVEGA